MKQRLTMLFLCLGLSAFCAFGCKAQDDITPGPTPKPVAPEVIVNNQGLPPEHVIEVTGYGEVIAAPDYATITLMVQGSAETAEAASAKCTENLKTLYDVATSLNVLSSHIKDAGVTITALTRESDGAITGYSAVDTVTITARDITTANSVVSGIVDASVSELKSVTYSITDTTAAYQEALTAAMGDASQKAAAIALAGEVQLGAVIGVTELTGPDSSLAGESFETSDIAVPAQVTVRYLIK